MLPWRTLNRSSENSSCTDKQSKHEATFLMIEIIYLSSQQERQKGQVRIAYHRKIGELFLMIKLIHLSSQAYCHTPMTPYQSMFNIMWCFNWSAYLQCWRESSYLGGQLSVLYSKVWSILTQLIHLFIKNPENTNKTMLNTNHFFEQ